jgi:hypothetical protein
VRPSCFLLSSFDDRWRSSLSEPSCTPVARARWSPLLGRTISSHLPALETVLKTQRCRSFRKPAMHRVEEAIMTHSLLVVHERWHGQEIDAVEVFNQLNSAIVRLPEYPRAIDTLQRHLPLLKKMQCLLSQRPRRGRDEGFTKPNYIRGKTIRIAREVTKAEEIPSWSSWIHAYSQAIGFSVRHIQRLIFDPEHDRYLERRRERRRYQRRKRQGICAKCSEEASEGIYCAFHAMEHRARSRAAYEPYRKNTAVRRSLESTLLIVQIQVSTSTFLPHTPLPR